jgi:hypothetical protein
VTPTQRPQLGGLVAGIVAGAIVGALLVFAFRERVEPGVAAAQRDPVAATPDPAELRALAGELRKLREALERAGTVGAASERQAVPGAGDADLVSAIRRLTEALDASRSAPSPRASETPASGDASKLWGYGTGDGASERVSDDHRLWSYRDVLEVYGMPTGSSVWEGKLLWSYTNDELRRSVVFHFLDGMVVSCRVNSW